MMAQKRMRKFSYVVFSIFLICSIILLTSATSAGWLDRLKTITGKATTQPTNVSIAVTGVNSVGITIWNYTIIGTGDGIDPGEGGYVNVSFNVTITDSDGRADINQSSVKAIFNMTGQDVRTNSTCAIINTANTSTSYNFTCNIQMWYFDEAGQWTINVTANDLGNMSYISNWSNIFTYKQLQAIIIEPPQITWPSVTPGNENQTANLNTTINNTGNYNIAAESLQIMGRQLHGETTSSEYIAAGNFTVRPLEGGIVATAPLQCNNTNTLLTNGSWQSIIMANLSAGNFSAPVTNATEILYYCLREVPSTISSQTYSTVFAGSWTIKLT